MIGYKQLEYFHDFKIGWSGILVGVAAVITLFASVGSLEQNAYATDYTVDQTYCEARRGGVWADLGGGSFACTFSEGLGILSGDKVTIPANVFLVIENSVIDPTDMLIQGTLHIDNDGTLQVNQDSVVLNESWIEIGPGGNLLLLGGSLTNSHFILINDGSQNNIVSQLTIEFGGEVVNHGDILIHQSGVLIIFDGALNNALDGEIVVYSVGTLTITDNGSLVNDGTINNSGSFGKYCGGIFVQNGTLFGSGPSAITTCPVAQISSAVVDRKGNQVSDGGTTSKSSITFTFSASGGVGAYTFECSLDNAGFTPCLTGVTFSRLSGGDHTFQVRVTDENSQTDLSDVFDWSIRGKR